MLALPRCAAVGREVPRSEAQAVLVDADQGELRRCNSTSARAFALDVSLGVCKRPAVLFRDYVNFFLGEDSHVGSDGIFATNG
jgi:hypothetical protein